MKYQTDGQVGGPKTLKDLRAISEFKRKYKVDNIDEYSTEIKRMPLVDLQSHAISVDVVPSNDRKKLERRLLDKFVSARANFDFANLGSRQPKNKMSKEKRDKILEIGKYLS